LTDSLELVVADLPKRDGISCINPLEMVVAENMLYLHWSLRNVATGIGC